MPLLEALSQSSNTLTAIQDEGNLEGRVKTQREVKVFGTHSFGKLGH